MRHTADIRHQFQLEPAPLHIHQVMEAQRSGLNPVAAQQETPHRHPCPGWRMDHVIPTCLHGRHGIEVPFRRRDRSSLMHIHGVEPEHVELLRIRDGQQASQNLRLHIIVAVAEPDPLPFRQVQALVARHRHAGILLPVAADIRLLRHIAVQRYGLFRGPVVHHDDLIVRARQILVQQRIEHGPDPAIGIVVWDDDAEFHSFIYLTFEYSLSIVEEIFSVRGITTTSLSWARHHATARWNPAWHWSGPLAKMSKSTS